MPDWEYLLWMLCYVLVFAGLSLFGTHRIKIIYLYWKHRDNTPKPLREFDELPAITVQLPIFNELHVVERLLQAVTALDYPRDKLHIQVLDDSSDETRAIVDTEVAELVRRGFHAVSCAGRTAQVSRPERWPTV
jgi:cellulose synthase/poly-beta-1,6-N-acetylglucosamine synthase-like glycosyltransferase